MRKLSKRAKRISESIEAVLDEWKILQDPDEVGAFLSWCMSRGVKSVLELGTGERGGFARFLIDEMGWNVVSVDIRDVPDHPGEFINASTVDAYPNLYGRDFDMVFVDAEHSYNAAIRDFRMYQHHAPIITVHDVGQRDRMDAVWADGVGQAWDEIAETNDSVLRFINAENPHGIGLVERAVRQRVNLSIVTGTHNRFEMLRGMVESARAQIPRGITYEFVIVAQGCTDGSLEWLREQEDVYLIEYPDLIGGIRAFNIGCYAARGDFVLVANDDIKFHNGSILRAISHLAETPTCGQVAFAPHPPGRVKVMPATLDGKRRRVWYGETCLVPKWLGDWCDWWGAYSGMSPRADGLYGGDNYLSSSIWQAGYKVDAVEGVSIDDYKPNDAIKERHADSIAQDNARYNTVFPTGAELGNPPRFGPRPRALRILNMPIIANERSRASKHSELEALQEFALVAELDFLNDPVDPARVVRTWQPDMIFTQFHSPRGITPETLARMRAAKPDTVVINRNFDAQDIKHHHPEVRALLAHVDLHLHKEMDKQERFDRDGVRAAYWIEGYETPVRELPDVEAYDVVVQMNIYDHRRLLARVIEKIAESGDISVGMFGKGWSNPTGNTHYDFTAGHALYSLAKIAISDTFPNTKAYMSRRVAQIMAAGGAICLLQHSPGLDDAIGFEAGVHYDEWHSYDELEEKISYWLDGRRESKRKRMAKRAQEFAQENLSCPATMRMLWYDILPEVFGERD
jgi:glycosyltransferase involved in cell wall biosynthesis